MEYHIPVISLSVPHRFPYFDDKDHKAILLHQPFQTIHHSTHYLEYCIHSIGSPLDCLFFPYRTHIHCRNQSPYL